MADKHEVDEAEKARLGRIATLDEIEHGIAPLRFRPPDIDQRPANYVEGYGRTIITPEGEIVGRLLHRSSGYSWKRNVRWRVESERIPSHKSYYTSGGGSRDYKKIASVIAAIKKFCIAVSSDETRANVLRKELSHYREVLQQAYRRSLLITGEGYGGSARVDGFISLLASGITQDRLEFDEYIRVLVRKKKVNNRFTAWAQETLICPRQKELDALDTSKEKVST
jgi:hypothetical protein